MARGVRSAIAGDFAAHPHMAVAVLDGALERRRKFRHRPFRNVDARLVHAGWSFTRALSAFMPAMSRRPRVHAAGDSHGGALPVCLGFLGEVAGPGAGGLRSHARCDFKALVAVSLIACRVLQRIPAPKKVRIRAEPSGPRRLNAVPPARVSGREIYLGDGKKGP